MSKYGAKVNWLHVWCDASRICMYTMFQKKFTLLVFTVTKSDVDQF